MPVPWQDGPIRRAFGTCFFSLLVLTNYFIVHIGCTVRNTRRGEKWKVVMTKTGPNDAKSIVWSIIRYLSLFFVLTHVFRLSIPFNNMTKGRGGQGGQRHPKRAQTTRFASFGPLVGFSFFFFVLTRVFRYYYIFFSTTTRVWVGGDGENGPRYAFLKISRFFCTTN